MEHLKINYATEEQLVVMILEENAARSSQEYIDACSKAAEKNRDWLEVTAKMQEKIVAKYFSRKIDQLVVLHQFRSAQYLFPENPIFKTPVYVRENKANAGHYNEGDLIPNHALFDLDGKSKTMHELCQNEGTTIFISGSHT